MKLRYKVLVGVLVFLGLAIGSLAVTMSYTSDCSPAPEPPGGVETVKVYEYRCYGSPEVLELNEIEKPVPGADQVLVRVKAASVNPYDWHYLRGEPYVMRLMAGIGAPKETRLGADFAGIIEAVGSNVTSFDVGDAVFGMGSGAFGEYLLKNVSGSIAKVPPNASFAQAAALPIAGVTALQALRDFGKLRPGQHVLINGASGGVGTLAVQLAKAQGAIVTGVCSERNREMVLSIGADHVIDYRQSNYTEGHEKYDVIVDMIGNHSMGANLDVLQPDGRLVIVGGQKGNWIGPMINMIKAPILGPFVDQEISVMLATGSSADLVALAEYMEKGELLPVIDRSYPLDEVPAAIAYSEEGHARGKIVIEID